MLPHDFITSTPPLEDKKVVLESLAALLDQMDIESNDLQRTAELNASFEEQIQSLEAQREVVEHFVITHRATRETVSDYLCNTFTLLILTEDCTVADRNARFLGLYRSAAASIMKPAWPSEGPEINEWIESFQRLVERKRKEVIRSSRHYSRIGKLEYLATLEIEPELYTNNIYTYAPKEYWLQYAAFSVMGSVLSTRKLSGQLREEMRPALQILGIARGKNQVPDALGVQL